MKLKLLFFGDIVGKIGRKAITKILPELKKKHKPDLILANAENLAHGIGLTAKTIKEMKEAGIDYFTSGNHIYKKETSEEVMRVAGALVLRPANYPPKAPGLGEKMIELGVKKILMVNLIGRVFMSEDFDCPFRKFDEIYEKYKKDNPVIIVDFHAEATSEKIALGQYLNGRATVVLGTHTHVPTADIQILSKGTAYVSDVGMVGAFDSVIGVDKKNIIEMFLTQMPFPHEIPESGQVQVNAVSVEIDAKARKAIKIERLDQIVEV